MIILQVLNKILQDKDYSIIQQNNLTADYFKGYEEEFEFIIEHWQKYKAIPDKETFVERFNNFDFFAVTETNDYLIERLNEEHLYFSLVPVIQGSADLLKSDSVEAVDFLLSELRKLENISKVKGKDIISSVDERYELYKQKLTGEKRWHIPTGFEELDSIIKGWSRGEEFAVIFARTGQGKSWLLIKTLATAWKEGFRVGYISPEMTSEKIGYRFDTLLQNFSNTGLVWGEDVKGYSDYAKSLKENKNPFIVTTPLDFQRKITVSKIRSFCNNNKLDILGIDGLTYLMDERHKKGDTKTITLTNISEDIMELSLELQIPIITAVQSNRGGVKNSKDKGTPELEHIRDSDGIAQNATKVISMRQTGPGFEMAIKKHRDGSQGGSLLYFWNIDKGIFSYIPSEEDSLAYEQRTEKSDEIRNSYDAGEDVF